MNSRSDSLLWHKLKFPLKVLSHWMRRRKKNAIISELPLILVTCGRSMLWWFYHCENRFRNWLSLSVNNTLEESTFLALAAYFVRLHSLIISTEIQTRKNSFRLLSVQQKKKITEEMYWPKNARDPPYEFYSKW